MLRCMSQHESPYPRYSIGRDWYSGDAQPHAAEAHTGQPHTGQPHTTPQADAGPHSWHQNSVPQSGRLHPQAQQARSELVPPPPAGHRGLFVVVLLYVVAAFMALWTGASVAVAIEAVGERDGDQIVIGMFMAAASLVITAALGAWLIRIHRRRGRYQRILDAHYAQRFGHHLDGDSGHSPGERQTRW